MSGGILSPRVALVLGGGGARGFAHLGALRVLEAEGIVPDLLVGCSMGAVVAALSAFGMTAREAEGALREFVASPGFRNGALRQLARVATLEHPGEGLLAGVQRAWTLALFFATNALRPSFVEPEHVSSGLSSLLPDGRIEEAPRRLAVVATDLGAGEEVVLTRGPVRLAVQASSALAGVFSPVNWDGRQLVDGGYTSLVPVEAAFRLGADAVIAVDVSGDDPATLELALDGNTIQLRAATVLAEAHRRLLLRHADAVVRPSLGGIQWTDFDALDRLVALGEEACQRALPAVREALSRGRRERLLGLLRRRRWHVDLRATEPPPSRREGPQR